MLENHDTEISALAREICGAISAAIERYAFISNEYEDVLPEHFVAAYICNKLGDKYFIVMEPISSKLERWNKEANARLYPLQSVIAKLKSSGQIKPDLVFFRRADSSFLCMLELKRDRTDWDSDVNKIEEFLPGLDTCPHGIVASYCCVTSSRDSLSKYESRASQRGHTFVVGEKAHMHELLYRPFAELICNPMSDSNTGSH